MFATYPYLSSLPLCQRADGQLCFLFISAADEDLLSKGKQSIKRQALGSQDSENEILPEGDDDTLSSVDEKDLENLTGKFTACADFSVRSGPISISLLTFSAVTTRTTKFTPTITLHKNFLFPQTFFS